MIAAAIVTLAHPAFAAVGGGGGALAGIQTGATAVQNAAMGVGYSMAVGGIAFGGIHWSQHRDDWVGSAGRVLAGIAGGVVVGNAPALAVLGGGGALF
ncbi:MAG: hypothetical protein ACREM8_02810 [Vulcanimicrobiaceae bacterium]